jgi:hypothetical protein
MGVASCLFSQCIWHGGALHGLQVQGAKVSILSGASALPRMVEHLSKVPDSWSSCHLHLCPCPHFVTSLNVFILVFPIKIAHFIYNAIHFAEKIRKGSRRMLTVY